MKDYRKGYYVDLRILDNGNLEIIATKQAMEEADHFRNLSPMQALMELFEDFLCNGWEFVPPEKIGALTDAPILTNEIIYGDMGNVEYLGSVWWFPNYQIEDEIETLLTQGKVVFDLAKEYVPEMA